MATTTRALFLPVGGKVLACRWTVDWLTDIGEMAPRQEFVSNASVARGFSIGCEQFIGGATVR
jgi:hypothetical protein